VPDQFRADGKIYVVIAVVSVVLIGLFAYLFRLERKVTELEKRNK
jgi:CcmD family protein